MIRSCLTIIGPKYDSSAPVRDRHNDIQHQTHCLASHPLLCRVPEGEFREGLDFRSEMSHLIARQLYIKTKLISSAKGFNTKNTTWGSL